MIKAIFRVLDTNHTGGWVGVGYYPVNIYVIPNHPMYTHEHCVIQVHMFLNSLSHTKTLFYMSYLTPLHHITVNKVKSPRKMSVKV